MSEFLQSLDINDLVPIAVKLIRTLLILLGALILSRIIRRIAKGLQQHFVGLMSEHAGGERTELEKRAKTITGIIRNATSFVLWTTAFITILSEVGFNIGPILAGAGIAGLAVGFGAQNLVRDVISGLFMLIENQIRVGDVAVINGTGGLVEEINVRTTVLRSLDGTVHIFPNGSISSLSNRTREYSYYVFDIGVAYKEDTDRVIQAVQEVADEFQEDQDYKELILEPLEFLGVDQFADSSVIIKARIKTVPIKQWKVGREMNRRIKKKFDQVGIEIPFPHMSVYFGEASRPVQLQTEHVDKEEIKQAVQEALAERMREGKSGPEPRG
jgi:small conductance mechanosensitive channel